MNLGATALNAMAEKFGMNNPGLTIPLGVAASNYVIPPSRALTAFSAVGQFSDTVTPLQEAMLAAAIANRGTLMRPYLVKQVATASGSGTVETTPPTVLPARLRRRGRCGGTADAGRGPGPDGTANAFNTAAVGF